MSAKALGKRRAVDSHDREKTRRKSSGACRPRLLLCCELIADVARVDEDPMNVDDSGSGDSVYFSSPELQPRKEETHRACSSWSVLLTATEAR
jgi:hypothetical protein